MQLIDLRGSALVTSIQNALDAIVNRANVTAGNWQAQLTQKVAEFFATPNVIAQLNTRLAYVKERATAHGTFDALGPIATAQSKVAALSAEYTKAKPVVVTAVNKVQAAGGVSLSSDMLSSVATAGVRMASVFSDTKAQDAAIAAIERGVLTPAEAAALAKQLQNPNATRNTMLAVGAVAFVWLLLRRR